MALSLCSLSCTTLLGIYEEILMRTINMEPHISSTAFKLDVPGPLPGGDHLLVDSRKRPQTRRISGGRLKEVPLCFDFHSFCLFAFTTPFLYSYQLMERIQKINKLLFTFQTWVTNWWLTREVKGDGVLFPYFLFITCVQIIISLTVIACQILFAVCPSGVTRP